jgi:hypothetical protein
VMQSMDKSTHEDGVRSQLHKCAQPSHAKPSASARCRGSML